MVNGNQKILKRFYKTDDIMYKFIKKSKMKI